MAGFIFTNIESFEHIHKEILQRLIDPFSLIPNWPERLNREIGVVLRATLMYLRTVSQSIACARGTTVGNGRAGALVIAVITVLLFYNVSFSKSGVLSPASSHENKLDEILHKGLTMQ